MKVAGFLPNPPMKWTNLQGADQQNFMDCHQSKPPNFVGGQEKPANTSRGRELYVFLTPISSLCVFFVIFCVNKIVVLQDVHSRCNVSRATEEPLVQNLFFLHEPFHSQNEKSVDGHCDLDLCFTQKTTTFKGTQTEEPFRTKKCIFVAFSRATCRAVSWSPRKHRSMNNVRIWFHQYS